MEAFKKRDEEDQQLQKRAEKISALAQITPVRQDAKRETEHAKEMAAQVLAGAFLAFEKQLQGTQTKKLLTGEA